MIDRWKDDPTSGAAERPSSPAAPGVRADPAAARPSAGSVSRDSASSPGRPLTRCLTVWHEPIPKPRARVTRTGHAYTPTAALEAERRIREAWIAKYDPEPLSGAVSLSVTAYLPLPASTPKKRRLTALPVRRPDADNLAKTVLDALNRVAWLDDAQVVDLVVMKRYAIDSAPRWDIELCAADPTNSPGPIEAAPGRPHFTGASK